MQTNLYTDDSFRFNEVARELNQMISDDDGALPTFNEKHDLHKASFDHGG